MFPFLVIIMSSECSRHLIAEVERPDWPAGQCPTLEKWMNEWILLSTVCMINKTIRKRFQSVENTVSRMKKGEF